MSAGLLVPSQADSETNWMTIQGIDRFLVIVLRYDAFSIHAFLKIHSHMQWRQKPMRRSALLAGTYVPISYLSIQSHA
jgi:hypothetical protein